MKEENFSILVNSPLDSEYIQKLAFKAGYKWHYKERSAEFAGVGQLLFYTSKLIDYSDADYVSPRIKITYYFPKDALAIQERFYAPEYKVGDYVVLADNIIPPWSCNTNRFGEKVQEIHSLEENKIIFKGLPNWHFDSENIARHATEEEIKAYKEGDDIYIGEYKIEYYPEYIKVGCIKMSNRELMAFREIQENIKQNRHSFLIQRNQIQFSESESTFSVYNISKEKLNEIIKKAGIK